MTLVVIIGLLAIMAMPAFQKARIGTQNSRIANDLRVFNQAFENYVLEKGGWPKNADAGKVPEEMGGYLNPTVFEGRTVVGGRYCWNYQSGTYEAGIALTGSILDDPQAEDIDRIVDDGNLSTGSFQKDGSDFVLIMEP
ncbi:type IV pilin protein [Cerasicoccus maritimus]|uniref:type IV pilin protein n=1 Tax=Cerasicoccus maritimus TaxID=490089 RepID=UPI0028526408|nr:type II secretion system protein [Cerasicoccus maritimus]